MRSTFPNRLLARSQFGKDFLSKCALPIALCTGIHLVTMRGWSCHQKCAKRSSKRKHIENYPKIHFERTLNNAMRSHAQAPRVRVHSASVVTPTIDID